MFHSTSILPLIISVFLIFNGIVQYNTTPINNPASILKFIQIYVIYSSNYFHLLNVYEYLT